jgi:organic hydroperoxide reductase OsmC/OhrA
MAIVARKRKFRLPADAAIDAEVDLTLIRQTAPLPSCSPQHQPAGCRVLALPIVNDAHQICPYSRATRGNVDVAIKIV